MTSFVLFFSELLPSVENDDSLKGYRIPVFYISTILPLVLLLIDFSMNAIKFNYKFIILNLFILLLYFVVTVLGELAMKEAIFPKGEDNDVHPLYW